MEQGSGAVNDDDDDNENNDNDNDEDSMVTQISRSACLSRRCAAKKETFRVDMRVYSQVSASGSVEQLSEELCLLRQPLVGSPVHAGDIRDNHIESS